MCQQRLGRQSRVPVRSLRLRWHSERDDDTNANSANRCCCDNYARPTNIGGVIGLFWLGVIAGPYSIWNPGDLPFRLFAAVAGGYIFGGAQAAVAGVIVGIRTKMRGTFSSADTIIAAIIAAIIGNIVLFAWFWYPLLLRGEVLSLKWKTLLFYVTISIVSGLIVRRLLIWAGFISATPKDTDTSR
jgi:hypothetical protein